MVSEVPPPTILQSPFIYAMIVPIFQRKRCHICQRKHTCPFHEINIFGEQSSLSAETVALHKYIFRRPAVEVTEENAYVLQLLDCLKDI